MPTRIGGVQPGYLPWLGYFDQMMRVDAFVIADEMPYSSSRWMQRNRVKGPTGVHWLTLPVRPQRSQRVHEVRLDSQVPWVRRHMKMLRHFYRAGVDTRDTLRELSDVLDQKAIRLVDATVPTIRFLAECLGVRTPLLLSSEMGLEERYRQRFPEQPGPTHRIIAYMEALGGTELLEGESGRTYFDVPLFKAHGMRVTFHRYVHPIYPQLHGAFVSYLSAVDLLLTLGVKAAQQVLRSGTLLDDA